MPSSLPAPSLPAFTWDKFVAAMPERLRHRAARRHRVAAVRGDRRRHDRTAAPLQLRAGGAGRRQYRLGDVRRHLRHRHHRAHRHQCARRRARADLRAVPFRLPAAVHAVRRAAGRLHPARRARRRAAGRGLEDGGEIRVHRADPRIARRRAGAAVDLPAHRLRRPDHRHRGRRRPRRLPVPASHGGSGRGGERRRADHRRQSRRQRRAHRLRRRAGDRSRGDGLPHQRRIVLRRDRGRQHRARPRRRAAEILRARLQQRAADRHHRRQRAARLRAEARALRHPHLFRRRAAGRSGARWKTPASTTPTIRYAATAAAALAADQDRKP